ncbi:RFA2 [Candida jiufengensis]|uniref:RFA2 n=1 Tax=Candida jiufengensis TaxID=497108 RepID=UPI0022249306|nr:RFA2 [Candida jiufengensis]KAI5952346.1 RFA2 [Candida jiufengensis]
MSDYGNFGNYGGNYGDGGFSNTGFSQGGGFQDNNNNNNGGSSQNNKSQTRSSITPVTIKQINESQQPVPDGEFSINNVNMSIVSFIGVLRKVHGNQTSILITVEDGTGSIELRKWIDENVSTTDQELEKYSEMLNKYVNVSGALKLYNNNKNVQNAIIKPIEDSNQILYHYLNAINHHLKMQGISLPSSSGNQNGATTNNNQNQMFIGNNLSMVERILEFIRDQSKGMQEGVPIDYISRKLEISSDDSRRFCNELIEDGKIYAGFNEEAYLAI